MAGERTSRERFLARVRGALDGGAPAAAPDPAEALVRLASASEDLVAMFETRARVVGMSVHRASRGSLEGMLKGLLGSLGARRTALSIEDAALRTRIGNIVGPTIPWRDAPGLGALYDADVGITDVLAGMAETGTLVMRSSSSTTRGGFLVAPIHLALVPASRLVPDLIDAVRLLRPMPTSVVMVTGPSKTADIEGILITGVHGPKEVHIVLIEDA